MFSYIMKKKTKKSFVRRLLLSFARNGSNKCTILCDQHPSNMVCLCNAQPAQLFLNILIKVIH